MRPADRCPGSHAGTETLVAALAGLLAALFLCLCLMGSASATNFCETHGGHDYVYLDDGSDTQVIFPVAWDLKRIHYDLVDYYKDYYGLAMAVAESAAQADLESLFTEGREHGLNAVMSRYELGWMRTESLARGPDSSDYFVVIAGLARGDSLHVIAGGFHDDTTEAEYERHDTLIAYLEDYSGWQQGPGDFAGVQGFDEPDARFEGPGWDGCDSVWAWYRLVHYCRERTGESLGPGMPFTTFLDRWKTSDGITPWYQYTIPLFCGMLEGPVFNRYPVKASNELGNPTFTSSDVAFDRVLGATDLYPSDSVSYEAWTDQDELFAVDDGGVFRVYRFTGECDPEEDVGLDSIYGSSLPNALRDDPLWASSDFRSSDVGDRSSDGHDLNGAVAFVDADDPCVSRVYHCHGSSIAAFDSLPLPSGAVSALALCVGQYDYPLHHPTAGARQWGIIGQGDLRILLCFSRREGGLTKQYARVYGRDPSGDFSDVTGGSSPAGLDLGSFSPEGAYWGTFWPYQNSWWAGFSQDHSGFVVYDADGDYLYVYEAMEVAGGDTTWSWEASGEIDGAVDLDGGFFIARRTSHWPVYATGCDYLCHLTGTQSVYEAVFEFLTGTEATPDSGIAFGHYQSSPFDLPGSAQYNQVTQADAGRLYQGRWGWGEILLLNIWDGDSSKVYRSTAMIQFKPAVDDDGLTIAIDTASVDPPVSYPWVSENRAPLLPGARVNVTRRPYRAPLLLDPQEEQPPEMLLSLVQGQLDGGTTLADLAMSYDTMFAYGIDGTGIDNCLLANVRCAGRHSDGDQSDYYASQDTLLYLLVTPVVHGCRGIILRALDQTFECGNAGPPYPAGEVRCPPLLLNWGPSFDRTNVDMMGRVYDALRMITGKGTAGPDFTEVLLDTTLGAIASWHAFNAWWDPWDLEFEETPGQTALNFLAIGHPATPVSDDIYLLVVNDSDEMITDSQSAGSWVYFSGSRIYDYDVKECWGGFEPSFDPPYEGEWEPPLCVNFDSMPPYSASLVRLVHD